MNRFSFVLLAVGLALAGSPFNLRAEEKTPPTESAKRLKVVVHVNFSDGERQKHGLKNVANILKDRKDAEIEVVCHGAGIGLVVKDKSEHASEVARLIKEGVRFAGCENTLKEKSISKDSLLAGVVPVPSGAVEVIRKQQEGYGYFKP